MTWRIISKVGLLIMVAGAVSLAVGQNSNGEGRVAARRLDVKGKSIFELRCATCHGLDGFGGEHAPDVVRRAEVRALADEDLLDLIHDGIPEDGMPGFSDMGREDAQAVIAYLHFLQGSSDRGSTRGDPVRGRDLFVGKGGCSACHLSGSHGEFIAGNLDLAGFARDHQAGEIREAILRPGGDQQEIATAVARNGRKFSGTVQNEDNSSLQLQDADGRFYLLMKSSLVSVKRQTVPAMPADYAQRLGATELDDLVEYIRIEAGTPGLSSSSSGRDEESHAQH